MHKQQPWQKKVDTTFDVPMSSYNGAETCELVWSLSSFPNCKTSTSTSYFTETTDWPFQTPHWEKQTTENMPRFFRRGVVRSCSVMVEVYCDFFVVISHNASSKKIEQFLRRMHWKAYFFFNPDTATHSEDTHDFKSTKNPPRID